MLQILHKGSRQTDGEVSEVGSPTIIKFLIAIIMAIF